MKKHYLICLCILLLSIVSFPAIAQSVSSIVLDASSLSPINADAITGLALDPIAKDRSNRPCARIKLHINRMTPEEIRGIDVRAIGGNVMITKQMVALDGNGLIIELTAKNETRFYLHHDKLGDSNPVNLSLDGNKEYKMEAWNETKLSVVISCSSPGADVYVDGEYRGVIGPDNHLSVKDVSMGTHQLTIKKGTSDVVRQIQVTPDQVFFNLDSQTHSSLQGFVLFRVVPDNAQVWLDGELLQVVNGVAQKLTKYGTYSYSIQSPGFYTVQGELIVKSGQITQDVTMEAVNNAGNSYQDLGRIRIEGGSLAGAHVFVDTEYIGEAPLTTRYLTPGEHSVRIAKTNYFSYESSISVGGGSIYLLSPVLKPNFMTVRLVADEDAEIWVNGELKGTGVWKGDLANGEYIVESRKPNHKTSSDRITVKADMLSTDIRLSSLQAISGFLSITSTPIGATILIDGKNKGLTPLFLNDITIGQHKVSVIKDGYEQWEEEVILSEGQTMTVTPILRKSFGVETKDIDDITTNSVRTGGVIVEANENEVIGKGVVWSLRPQPTVDLLTKSDAGPGTAEYDCIIKDLLPYMKYYLRAYVITNEGVFYGNQKEFMTLGEVSGIQAIDLSSEGTANCYVINSSGTYSFPAVKGNSSESVGSVESASVLWESFGTSEKPSKGDLLSFVGYENGRIYVRTTDVFKEGNAAIAAVDKQGTILWSWHIWITDKPQEQVYANNAGTMMDRNLGATSVTPGNVTSLGLLYQWGRKDPFLNVGEKNNAAAKSTGKWPLAVIKKKDILDFSIKNPMTFIQGTSETSFDWISSNDVELWSDKKTIYDPCPVGWRVPDGGETSIWSEAGVVASSYDELNGGISLNVNSNLSSWYPAGGYIKNDLSSIPYRIGAAYLGLYWSVTTIDSGAYSLFFSNAGNFKVTNTTMKSAAGSVRCVKE